MAFPASKPTSITPPTPAYIFRHHEHPIHALHFFASNTLLASGDSSGLIIIWRLTTRRPVIVFQAHDGGIMGIKDWLGDRLITHGRDHRLRIWDIKLGLSDHSERASGRVTGKSSTLDADGERGQGESGDRKPWLLHALHVNALNFCAFAKCFVPNFGQDMVHLSSTTNATGDATALEPPHEMEKDVFNTRSDLHPPLLIAAPNGLDSGGIDIFELPSEKRVSQIRSGKDAKTGMVMALGICFDQGRARLLICAGYEDGSVGVYSQSNAVSLFTMLSNPTSSTLWTWQPILTGRVHSQPVLSLGISPDCESLITSSADAMIARFNMPVGQGKTTEIEEKAEPEKSRNTKHAGQQDLKIRSDGKIFATAGWDGNVRVYSTKTLKELAVLQWHKEGCYAVAFAEVFGEDDRDVNAMNGGKHPQSLIAMNGMDRMKIDRDRRVQRTHWLAAGSKDGKISLWDIY